MVTQKTVIISSPTVEGTTGSEASVSEVTVSSAEEFVKAIGSNKKILLKAGVYNLSNVKPVNNQDGTVTWKDTTDGKELNLKNITNLTIEGSETGKTEIKASPKTAYVLNFTQCNNVTIKNIVAGHTTADDKCEAGVLAFNDCGDITVSESELSGGNVGIDIRGMKNFTCESTMIRHSFHKALYVANAEAVEFNGCTITSNEAYDNIMSISKTKDITFSECEIKDNNGFIFGFMEIFDASNVVFEKCKITNNTNKMSDIGVTATFFTISQNSRLKIRDSVLNNNKSDHYKTSFDNITLENCETKNNTWK